MCLCVCVYVCILSYSFSRIPQILGLMYFFKWDFFSLTWLSVVFLIVSFSFIGTFILLTDSVLYPPHILSFLIVSSPHFYLQYWFSGGGWLFLLFQRVEVDKWFNNVHLSLSWLIDAFSENSTRIFQVLFFFLSFCPKVSFYNFMCHQDRKLRKKIYWCLSSSLAIFS